MSPSSPNPYITWSSTKFGLRLFKKCACTYSPGLRVERHGFDVYSLVSPLTNDMLHDSEGNRTRPTCLVHCKKCCRKERHFLNIRGAGYRFIYKVITLGGIGLVGQYRCVCCGTPRIGRFDFVRGRESGRAPKPSRRSWWERRRDSWKGAQRRQWWSNLFRRSSRRRSKYKHKPFKKKRRW